MTPRFVAAVALLSTITLSIGKRADGSRASGYLSHMLSGILHQLPEHLPPAPLVDSVGGGRTRPGHHCDLCAYNWLLVLAAGGRTGSTTAMSMFNSVPGFEIGGEHRGVLSDERAYFERVNQTEGAKGLAFLHRPHDLHSLRCSVQDRMKRLVFGTDYEQLSREVRVLGFKEIRYVTLPDMAFIASVFPCARYVFTYRANTSTEVVAYGFEKSLQHVWADTGLLYTHLSELFPKQTDMLEVESLTPERYSAVLHGLTGVRACSFSQIVHENSDGGYSPILGDGAAETVELLTGECDLSGVDFRLRPGVLQRNKEVWRSLVEQYNAHQQEEEGTGDEGAR